LGPSRTCGKHFAGRANQAYISGQDVARNFAEASVPSGIIAASLSSEAQVNAARSPSTHWSRETIEFCSGSFATTPEQNEFFRLDNRRLSY
jgi:hypothetical protein